MAKKAASLKNYMQSRIGKYSEDNPNVNIKDISLKFNVTYNQAYSAIQKYKAGLLKQPKPKKDAPPPKELLELDTVEILKKTYHAAVAELNVCSDVRISDKITMLDKAFSMRKTLQQIELEGHIKKTDAAIIAAIIRRFAPDSTDEDIIKIYREEMEKWKISQN